LYGRLVDRFYELFEKNVNWDDLNRDIQFWNEQVSALVFPSAKIMGCGEIQEGVDESNHLRS
jgi:hypothetical protein